MVPGFQGMSIHPGECRQFENIGLTASIFAIPAEAGMAGIFRQWGLPDAKKVKMRLPWPGGAMHAMSRNGNMKGPTAKIIGRADT